MLKAEDMFTLEMAWCKSSWLMGCWEMTQSPEGNLARGFLPKSITTSISPPISRCRYNSLLIFRGSSCRNISSSVEVVLAGDDPFPAENRSEGRRISGDAGEDLVVAHRRIPLRRNEEEENLLR